MSFFQLQVHQHRLVRLPLAGHEQLLLQPLRLFLAARRYWSKLRVIPARTFSYSCRKSLRKNFGSDFQGFSGDSEDRTFPRTARTSEVTAIIAK